MADRSDVSYFQYAQVRLWQGDNSGGDDIWDIIFKEEDIKNTDTQKDIDNFNRWLGES